MDHVVLIAEQLCSYNPLLTDTGAVLSSSGLVHLRLEFILIQFVGIFTLKFHRKILDNVLHERLVGGHLGLLHHGDVGSHPGHHHELGPLGHLVTRHDLDVSEASIVRPELRLELIELRPLGGHAQLVVLEDEGGPLDAVLVSHHLEVGLLDGLLVHGGGHVVPGDGAAVVAMVGLLLLPLLGHHAALSSVLQFTETGKSIRLMFGMATL